MAAAALGAALLVIGAFHPSWVFGRDFGITTHLGLLDMELCHGDGTCEPVSLSEATRPGIERYRIFALVSFVLGLLTALALLVTLGLAALRKHVEHGVQPSSLALIGSVFTLISGAVTLSVKPAASWGTGVGFLLFGAGAAIALLGAILLGRLKPPPSDSDLFDPPFDEV